MQNFVRRTSSLPFRRYWGDVQRESCDVVTCCSSWYFGFLSPRRFT
jgi:hypothetical protein